MDEAKYLDIISRGRELQEADDAESVIRDLSIDEIAERLNSGEIEPDVALKLLLPEADAASADAGAGNAATDAWHKKVSGGVVKIAKSAWSKMPQGLQNAAPWKLWLGGSAIVVASIAAGAGIKWLSTHHTRKIAMAAANKIKLMADAEGIEVDRAVMQYALKKLQKDGYTKIKMKNILNVHGGGREQLAMDRASDFLAREAMKMIRQRSGPRLPKIVPPPPSGFGPSERGFIHPPGHVEPITNLDMAQGQTMGTEFLGGHLPPARMDRPMGEGDYDMGQYEVEVEEVIDAVMDGMNPEEAVALLTEKGGMGRAIMRGAAKGAAVGGLSGAAGMGTYGLTRKGSAATYRKADPSQVRQMARDLKTRGMSVKGRKRTMRAATGVAQGIVGGAMGAGLGAIGGGAHGAYKHIKGKKKR